MNIARPYRLGWIVPQPSYRIASTRYRSYYPALALEEHGIESRFYRCSLDAVPDLSELSAIVFVKLADKNSLQLASLAKARGVKVLIDLCDNIIVANYPTTNDLGLSLRLSGISAVADAIVVPSPALADALRPVLRHDLKFVVIPDQVETRASVEAARLLQERIAPAAQPPTFARRVLRFAGHFARNPLDALAILGKKMRAQWMLRRARLPGAPIGEISGTDKRPEADRSDQPNAQSSKAPKTIVWFGNYGAPHSDFGMLALLPTIPVLEKLAREFPIDLVVVSNNHDLFQSAIAPAGISTRYIPWSSEAVFDVLQRADVCLLPFGVDPFSVTKSANRVVMALEHGVPVVTSRLASMVPLQDVVEFDDWERGLRRFLGPNGANERAAVIAAARPILNRLYSPKAIGEAWAGLLKEPTRKTRLGHVDGSITREIAVLVSTRDELAPLLPIIDQLNQLRGVMLRVLMSTSALSMSPEPVRAMIDRRIIPYALESRAVLEGDDRILRTLDALITGTETGDDPEGVRSTIVQIALNRHIPVYTLNNIDNFFGSVIADQHTKVMSKAYLA